MHTETYTHSYLSTFRQQRKLHVQMADSQHSSIVITLYLVLNVQVCGGACCHNFINWVYLHHSRIYLCSCDVGVVPGSLPLLTHFACSGQRSNICEYGREAGTRLALTIIVCAANLSARSLGTPAYTPPSASASNIMYICNRRHA